MKLIPSGTTREINKEIVLSVDRLQEIVSMIRDKIALDTEATGRHPVAADLLGISLCLENERAFYLPLLHTYPGAPQQMQKKDVATILSPFLGNEKIAKTGHNLKYDLILLEREGVSLKGPLFDTMIASYLLNPNRPNHSLEEVFLEYLSYRKKTFMEVLKKRSPSRKSRWRMQPRMHVSYTPAGVKAMAREGGAKRRGAVGAAIEALGGRMESFYYAFGKHDVVVIADLPDKTELKAFCPLSRKQAALYQQAVKDLAEQLEDADGIRRRGVVLAFLMLSKQICNHPSQWLGDGLWSEADSGKYARLREIAEVIRPQSRKRRWSSPSSAR